MKEPLDVWLSTDDRALRCIDTDRAWGKVRVRLFEGVRRELVGEGRGQTIAEATANALNDSFARRYPEETRDAG